MQDIVRWPGAHLQIDHNTAKFLDSSVMYQSWSLPPTFTTQIVNCIIMPAQAIKILSCRMMIYVRTGTTTNPCRFRLRVIDVDTGTMVSQLPTAPPMLNPMNTSLFPLMAWQTVYQAIPTSSAPIVNTGEYFGVVFTGVAGTQTAMNNLFVKPLLEVLVEY
jgi:hypothetical protein